MFCKKCGFEYPDNEEIKFCKQCGAMVINPLQAENPECDSTLPKGDTNQRKNIKKPAIAVLVAIITIVAIGAVFFVLLNKRSEQESASGTAVEANGFESFDPFADVTVSFEGENGSGIAKIRIDKINEHDDGLVYKLSSENGLSNGDTVKLSIQYKTNEDDFSKKYGKKPASLSKEYIVEGLSESTETAEEVDVSDETKEFLEKIKGVWGNGSYYEIYDGTTIRRGEFESETLPDVYISEVKKLSNNKYEVSIKDDTHIDGETYSYDGYDYVAIYDGTIDGFSVTHTVTTDNGEFTYLRMGKDMEEAWDYYVGDYEADWEMLSRADSSDNSEQNNLLEEFGINPNTVEDYSQNLDPNEYIRYNSGIEDFSFAYPAKLFCNVKVDETGNKNEYGKHIKTVTFYGSNGSELSYSLYERTDDGNIDDIVDRIHNIEKGRYYDAADILTSSDEEKGGKIVITGYGNASKDKLVYDSIRISNKYVYQMKTLNPMYKSDQEKLEYSYITENEYRMCKFSDSKKSPRSYEEYLEANN